MKIFFTKKQQNKHESRFFNLGRCHATNVIFSNILPMLGYEKDNNDWLHDDAEDIPWEEIRYGRIHQIIKKVGPLLAKKHEQNTTRCER